MLWIFQCALNFVFYSAIDFILFVIIDSFAKLLIDSRDARTDAEKKTIWKWESLVLLGLCVLVYMCDHTPFLLIALTVVTFVYTQLEGRINLFEWWTLLRTRWEEYQQHQDSMKRMQEQLSEQRRQQEWLINARNLSKAQGAISQVQPNFPIQQPQHVPTSNLNLLQRHTGYTSQIAQPRGLDTKWSTGSVGRLGAVFNRLRGDTGNNATQNAPPAPTEPPKMQQEFSFMPRKAAKQNEIQHFGTDMDDSPPRKSAWFGDNLVRRPLRSSQRIPYSPVRTPDTVSLKSKVLSALGVAGHNALPPGIRNEGQNLCFMNSVLQCIARTPNLLNELTTEAKSNTECSVAESLLISSLVEILESCSGAGSRKSVLDLIGFRQAAATLRPDLVALPTQRQTQQDAAEFFMWLMDSVHIVLNKNRKSKPGGDKKEGRNARMKMLKFIYGDLNPAKLQDLKKACHQEINAANGLMSESYAEPVQRLSDLEWLSYKQQNDSIVDNTYTGQLVIAYHCLTDNHISVNMQTFSILPVPIVQPREMSGLVMLNDCFAKYCNIEHLVGQEGLECGYCNSERLKQQNEVGVSWRRAALQQQQANSASPFTSRTPQVNLRQTRLSSVDSAVSGVHSPLPSNFMSPIPGCKEFVNDSGFQDNEFKTSTPISDQVFPGQRLRDAERRCLLRQLPDCLVIQLMRFSYNPFTRNPGKVNSPISIPLRNLDLTEIMFDTITNREDLAEEDVCYKYNLYGVCCHMGAESTNFGHYVSYCLHVDGKWYKFDDEIVTEVNMEYELTSREIRENAYILFYKKCNL